MRYPDCPTVDLRGSHAEVGFAHGRAVRDTLARDLREYVSGLVRAEVVDPETIRRESPDWFEGLPGHYREELEAVARGAEMPLLEIVTGLYAGAYPGKNCSSIVVSHGGETWIAHNNDWYDFGSHRWTSAVVRAVAGKIPHVAFGLAGDVCTMVGINRERLWLQANGFPGGRSSKGDPRPSMSYVFVIREALDTCSSIEDLESLLRLWTLDQGLAIYVVDGKTGDSALFECGSGDHVRRDPLAETLLISHSRDPSRREGAGGTPGLIVGSNTTTRVDRVLELLEQRPFDDPAGDLIRILADADVEDRGRSDPSSGTLYSNVACPGRGRMLFACGEFPAASRGTWYDLAWPWD